MAELLGFVLVVMAACFAGVSAWLARRQGRSALGWAVGGAFLGPVAVLFLLVLSPASDGVAAAPMVRPPVVLVTLGLCCALGALIGVTAIAGAVGVNPSEAGHQVAEQHGGSSVGVAGGVMVAGAAMAWDLAAGAFGAVAGGAVGLTVSPFAALAIESVLRRRRRPS